VADSRRGDGRIELTVRTGKATPNDADITVRLGREKIGGDPIVAVLPEQVCDAHLAGLRRDGVSYIFTGERDLDLGWRWRS
jgi:hypothetical protein